MTPSEMKDLVLDRFNDNFPAAAATIAGETVRIVWDDKDRPGRPKEGEAVKHWVFVSVQHAGGGQESLGGDDGTSRYGLDALLLVQVFAPQGLGRKTADQLAELVMSIFRGARDGSATYRNHRMAEAGNSGPWSQTNVSVGIQYSLHQ